jgi:hypothetical protein
MVRSGQREHPHPPVGNQRRHVWQREPLQALSDERGYPAGGGAGHDDEICRTAEHVSMNNLYSSGHAPSPENVSATWVVA